MREITFTSGGERCAGWHLAAATDALASARGRPCAVMAHGFTLSRGSGLEPHARRLAAAGLDVVAFDYRYFGDSEGEPRGLVAISRQRADFHGDPPGALSPRR